MTNEKLKACYTQAILVFQGSVKGFGICSVLDRIASENGLSASDHSTLKAHFKTFPRPKKMWWHFIYNPDKIYSPKQNGFYWDWRCPKPRIKFLKKILASLD